MTLKIELKDNQHDPMSTFTRKQPVRQCNINEKEVKQINKKE